MLASPLIDPQNLSNHLDDANLCIIDCRFDLANPKAGRRNYLDAHIAGAVFADLNDDLAAQPTAATGRHPLPDIGAIAATFGRLGVDRDTRVVVYDAGSGGIAARAWWLLRWLGHEDVALLNGGLALWNSLRLPLDSGEARVVPKLFEPCANDEWVITTEELCAGIEDIAALNLLDARDRARFSGEAEPIDPVAGHVPGARNFPFSKSLNADGTWKSTQELQLLWKSHLGEDRSVEWAAMCGSGVTACHLAISSIQAGYRPPRLYIGSWSEWIRNPDRPVGIGED